MPGKHHEITINEDEVPMEDKMVGDAPEIRRQYIALKPLFKNGQEIAVGDTVMLHPLTGARAIEVGDVEEDASWTAPEPEVQD